MNSHLTWRELTIGDRAHFEKFTCADPEHPAKGPPPSYRQQPHPCLHEYKVQCTIRRDLPKRVPHGTELWLGFDEQDQLAALTMVRSTGESMYQILLTAVSQRYRGQGIGHEAKGVAMAAIERLSKESGERSCTIFSHIHQDNIPSQKLAESWGFSSEELHGDVQIWMKRI